MHGLRPPAPRSRLGFEQVQDPASPQGEPEPGRTPGAGSRAIRNTALVLAARIVSRLLALVTVIAMARHVQDAGFGQFNIVINTTAVVVVLVDLGFNTLYVREGARHPREIERYLNNVLSVKALMSVVALGVLAGALGIQGRITFLLPAYALMVLTAYSNLLRGTLYAIQSITLEAVAIVLESVLLLVLILIGIATGQGVSYFLWAYAGSYAFSCLYFGIALAVRRGIRYRWRFETDLIRTWFWTGLPFALTFVLTILYFKIDTLLLGAMRGDRETGWYGLAYKPFEAILFVPMSMLNVVFPVMAVFHRESPSKLKPAVDQFFRALVFLGWPLTVGSVLIAPGIAWLLRFPFPQSEPAFRILALGIVFMFAGNAFVAALNAMDRQRLFTWAAAASLAINLVLNFILIPLYGYLGASWATVLTEVALVVIGAFLVGRSLGRVPMLRLTWRILLAGAVMGLVIFPFRDATGWGVLGVIALGIAVYAAAALVLRAVQPGELAIARGALGLSRR